MCVWLVVSLNCPLLYFFGCFDLLFRCVVLLCGCVVVLLCCCVVCLLACLCVC